MSKKYSTQSLEERKQQMSEILTNLEDGIRGVFTSENYMKYLETFSKFHSYSYNNVLLILMQYPEATQVASYKDWQIKFRRVPKKGEKGIKILIPAPKKVTETHTVTNQDGTTSETEVERKRMYFKVGHVFDLSQTIGDPLPSLVKSLGYNSKVVGDMVQYLINTSEVPVFYDNTLVKETDPNGYYNVLSKEIFLKPSLSSLHKLKTLIHEYSHYLQETIFAAQVKDFTRSEKEVVAESCAYVVLSILSNELEMDKLDSSEYSFGYIASWGTKDLSELKSTLSLISILSNQIYNWISKQFVVS